MNRLPPYCLHKGTDCVTFVNCVAACKGPSQQVCVSRQAQDADALAASVPQAGLEAAPPTIHSSSPRGGVQGEALSRLATPQAFPQSPLLSSSGHCQPGQTFLGFGWASTWMSEKRFFWRTVTYESSGLRCWGLETGAAGDWRPAAHGAQGRLPCAAASPLPTPHSQLLPRGPRRHFTGTTSPSYTINCFVLMFIDSERHWCACVPGVQGLSWLC